MENDTGLWHERWPGPPAFRPAGRSKSLNNATLGPGRRPALYLMDCL